MTFLDVAIVILYFVVVIGLGCWFARRAATNMESYFLGGKRMHWLALAMSGSVSNFDITGTMWIVSIIMLLGMKSMWHHWMWGFLLGAFFMSYMGKWVRRSNVMTAAEWKVQRLKHLPYNPACRCCVAGRKRDDQHTRREVVPCQGQAEVDAENGASILAD